MKLFLFIFCLVIFGCDPVDDRLRFQNNSSKAVIVRMFFDDELPNNSRNPNRSKQVRLNPNEDRRVGIYNKWEGEFIRALPDSLLNIIIIPDYNFEKEPKKWDSIYNIGGYYLKKISLNSIKKQGWLINYPDDFKKTN